MFTTVRNIFYLDLSFVINLTLISFAGTTWTMEMVWLIENDCDFEAARRLISGRYFYLE